MTGAVHGLRGLQADVTIDHGAGGVPTVRASCLSDGWAGLGHAVATDRLFQLDLLRRSAAGRLAELFGPSAVAQDIAQRRAGLTAAADRALGELPADQRAVLTAYTDGVNAVIATAPPPLELEVLGLAMEPWRPRDSLLVALLLAQMLSGDGEHHRMRALMAGSLPPDVVDFLLGESDPYLVGLDGRPAAGRKADPPLQALRALLAEAPGPSGGDRQVVASDDRPWGSNALALAGSHTTDGRALLANDMHLPLGAPTLFHRAGLRWPGGRVDGVTVPGLPVFVTGVSTSLAWGATRLAADVVELVEVRRAHLATRRERILVLHGDPVDVEVQDSPWGPVEGPGPDGVLLARHWVGRDPGAVDLGLGALMTAGDVDAGTRAARQSGGPPLNVLLADSGGRIAWTVSGRFPVRDGTGPVTPDHAWTAHRRPHELPHVTDPASGRLVSANNGVREHREVRGLAANHFSARRAARIGELLDAGGTWDERRLLALQSDTDAEFYAFYRDLALTVLTDPVTRADEQRGRLREAVRAWDGTARTDAIGLAVLVAWRELLRESLFAALLSRCAARNEDFVYCWHSHESPLRAMLDDASLFPPPHRDQRSFLLFELDVCGGLLRHLAPETGPEALRWGALNPTGIRHPMSRLAPELAPLLDLPQDEMPGCPESVCAARPGFGPAVRLAASPGRPAQALLNLPGGQSGDPRSPFYSDQFAAWLTAAPRPLDPPPAGGATTRLVPIPPGEA
ncbi:penicillin acylase family protein [Streptomyces sp. NBC_01335]|uniref:penicillin acylase family protein n=1 Tax=Streptomyces sp. NBC_01335 TaxID=2903828 RepID=UPI002E1042D3|nr:penicillin acylase family protein [Streptomyces sp. NBC_01335]